VRLELIQPALKLSTLVLSALPVHRSALQSPGPLRLGVFQASIPVVRRREQRSPRQKSKGLCVDVAILVLGCTIGMVWICPFGFLHLAISARVYNRLAAYRFCTFSFVHYLSMNTHESSDLTLHMHLKSNSCELNYFLTNKFPQSLRHV